MLCKAFDESLGAGDQRIYDYDPENKYEEYKKFMEEHFEGQPALIMDFAKPSKDLGVHAFDILTMTKPDGSI